MREPTDPRPAVERFDSADPLTEEVRAAGAGLGPLLAEAKATWTARAEAADSGTGSAGSPSWRPFEDAFPTFYQFTNRPR